LLGVYLAEGCPYVGIKESSVHFVLSETETDTAMKIRKVCKSFGCNVYTSSVKNEKAIHMRFRSVVLARFFKEALGDSCYNKRIPDFVLYHKDLGILQSCLEGYIKGDGSRSQTRGYNINRFSTASRTLALQVQLAYARLEVFVAIRCQRKPEEGLILGRKVHLHDQYVGDWGEHSDARLHDGCFYLPIQKTTREPYAGTVCNLSTTDNTFLVSNAVVHNCSVNFRNYFDEVGNLMGGNPVTGYAFFTAGIATPATVAQCPAPVSSCSYPPPTPQKMR